MNKNGEVLSEVGVSGATSGFVLLEASDGSFSDAVELVVEIGGQEVYAYTPPVSFCDVDGMYRWRNIRQAGGGTCVDTFSPEGNDGPPGRPDGECDGTHLVFLHGYNVNEREARVWARAVFKRLWWAGMESMFTAVAWHGDDGQMTFARHVITPDYQRNVEHAFASASNLAATVNSLPGRKFMMAHSLGNMLVSAARQDHGLQYEKYFMVNAAVPVEAYDPAGGVKTYVDGRQVSDLSSESAFTNVRTASGTFYLGVKPTNLTHPFRGCLDEVKVYAAALSKAQVRAALRAEQGQGTRILPAGTDMTVDSGAKLSIGAGEQTVSSLAGGGTVAIATNACLTTSDVADFTGSVTGTGTLGIADGTVLDFGDGTSPVLTVEGTIALGADITVNTTFTGGTYTLMRAGSFEGVENLASWSDSPKVKFFVSSDGKSLQMSIFSGTTIIFR